MGSVKALDELTLADLWREVPRDRFWEDTGERLCALLKRLLEGSLEEEMVTLLGAGRYRRTEARRGYRNGFYERDLATQIGIVTALRVPRAHGLGGDRAVFERYRRRQVEVDRLIRDTFVRGVSTREVGKVLAGLLGEPVSAQTVSRVARSLDAEVQAFHEAPLEDDVRYLLLDGVSLRLEGAGGVKRRMVLCAYGITVQGERRLLDFQLARRESQGPWEAFLSALRERGLEGCGWSSWSPTGVRACMRRWRRRTPSCRCSAAGRTSRATWPTCSSAANRVCTRPTHAEIYFVPGVRHTLRNSGDRGSYGYTDALTG